MKWFDLTRTFFTDECSVWFDSSRVIVWTKKGQTIFAPTFSTQQKVHLWGRISLMGTSHLNILKQNLNQEVYIITLNESLTEEARAMYGQNWILPGLPTLRFLPLFLPSSRPPAKLLKLPLFRKLFIYLDFMTYK